MTRRIQLTARATVESQHCARIGVEVLFVDVGGHYDQSSQAVVRYIAGMFGFAAHSPPTKPV